MKQSIILTVVCLIILLYFPIQVYSWDPPLDVDVVEIKFNWTTGSENTDATTIKNNSGVTITAPEWRASPSKNDPFAYIKGLEDIQIQAKFCHNQNPVLISDMHIKADAEFGPSPGNLPETQVNYGASSTSDLTTFTSSGSVYGSVWKGTFLYDWEVRKINGYTDIHSIGETNHTHYVVYASPTGVESDPSTKVLDYSCVWASGKSTADNICTDICNSFGTYYYYGSKNGINHSCQSLSSDYVHMVNSLGVSATMHKWQEKYPDTGWWGAHDMSDMETNPIDTVPTGGGSYTYYFYNHVWVEAGNKQRDPTTAGSRTGTWGNYEDYLFDEYEEMDNDHPTPGRSWVANQTDQPPGSCEDHENDNHCYKTNPPPSSSFVGPNN